MSFEYQYFGGRSRWLSSYVERTIERDLASKKRKERGREGRRKEGRKKKQSTKQKGTTEKTLALVLLLLPSQALQGYKLYLDVLLSCCVGNFVLLHKA